MKTLVIIIHPAMHQSKVNLMWKDALQQENIDVCDLYELYPDSKLDIEVEQNRLLNYDNIVFQFPLYCIVAHRY